MPDVIQDVFHSIMHLMHLYKSEMINEDELQLAIWELLEALLEVLLEQLESN